MENELVKRYIYAVTQKLPEAQRADIAKELGGLIEDMLEDHSQGRPATEKEVEAVLLELGSPDELADKYRGSKRYLIGPGMYSTYIMVLKIVLGAVGIAMFIVFLIQTVMTPAQTLDHFVSAMGSIWMAFLQAFAWVTVIFAIMDRVGVEKGKLKGDADHDWKLSDLPQLPEETRRINPAEPITAIAFTMLFVALLTSAISFFGIWVIQQDRVATVIPFFNETVFRSFLPFIWAVAALSILNEAVKLIVGKWTLPLVALNALVYIANFALAMFMLSNAAIWNPNFMQQLVQAGFVPAGSSAYQTVSMAWQQATQYLVYFIAIVFIIEMVSSAFKAFRVIKMDWNRGAARSSTG